MCDHSYQSRRFGGLLRHRCMWCGHTVQMEWAGSPEQADEAREKQQSANRAGGYAQQRKTRAARRAAERGAQA